MVENSNSRKLLALVVDDEDGIREILCDILENFGVSSIEARNGKEALEFLNDKIDYVFTDINMPVMDGFTFLRKVKSMGLENPPAFFVVSGSFDKQLPQHIQEEFKNIICGNLLKPFDEDAIQNLLTKFVQRQTA